MTGVIPPNPHWPPGGPTCSLWSFQQTKHGPASRHAALPSWNLLLLDICIPSLTPCLCSTAPVQDTCHEHPAQNSTSRFSLEPLTT